MATTRSNNQNRDATPGQKAMATAMAFPEPKRGMHSELIGSTGRGYDKAALSRARFVLRNNPPAPKSQFPQYALDVMDGRMTLTEAYDATGGRTWIETNSVTRRSLQLETSEGMWWRNMD